MDLLGSFGNGYFSEGFSAASSFRRKEPISRRALRQSCCFSSLLADASNLHLHIIQAGTWTLGGMSKTYSYKSTLNGQDMFKVFGTWQVFMGGWSSLLSSYDNSSFEGTPDASHVGKKTIVALFRSSFDGTNSKGRTWTNILIGLNVLMFVAQEATHGRLLTLGAKVNHLIDKGQLWRFITPAFLHANIPHLLTNCYSLNSIGPVIEAQGGPARFLAVYLGSAIIGFYMSYSFTRAPAVGASGAVFGLVGSLGVFLLRHKDILSGASQSLSGLARMIAINMLLGLSTSKIDNWGHLGGLLGGVLISWLLGPSYSFQQLPGETKRVLVDRPPISYLFSRQTPLK